MSITYRSGTLADVRAAYEVFVSATADLDRKMGTPDSDWADPAFTADFWVEKRNLFEHLTRTGERFEVAERDGQVVGFARVSLHDGVREVTEFFVLPQEQSAGIGGELLARAFPLEGARRRMVMGTTDIRALVCYLKAGVYPRFPIYHFRRPPVPVVVETDLVIRKVGASPATLETLSRIDREILEFARPVDHEYLLSEREVCLYYRGDAVVGYGYFGSLTGPIALLSDTDFPAVLARGESEAAARGEAEFELNVPLINRTAVDYLLEQGYRLDPFVVLLYSDLPFGKFENYIVSSPDFFI